MNDRFEPDDPLVDRPEPDYVELVDPDPPPSIPERPWTIQTAYGGAPWSGLSSLRGVRRWILVLVIGVLFVVPVVAGAIVLFLQFVS